MAAVWRRMTSFSVPMSFHTSLVLIRPAGSNGAKASPLRVRFQFSDSKPDLSAATVAWGSSPEMLAIVS
ncbi:hypothetical protein N7490_006563 [Penicillium lividum]|nr:hypothetical protein N7490_006563 [Penicillium lividum]